LLKLNVFVLCSSKVFCTYSTEQSEGVHFLSIRQSKYQKYTPTGCFFGDFAHWNSLAGRYYSVKCFMSNQQISDSDASLRRLSYLLTKNFPNFKGKGETNLLGHYV